MTAWGSIDRQLVRGGWIPKGLKWERGEIPAKYDRFQEMGSADYLKRTEV